MNGPIGLLTAAGDRWEAPGELTYNGVGLGSLHKLRDFKVEPVPDRANRTTAYNKVSLAFSWYIQFDPRYPVGRSQNHLEFLERSLSKPGGHFKWDRRGVGLLEVNKPGGRVKDVTYGPKPKVISLELLGASANDAAGDLATFKVEWAVELNIPMCADAAYQFAPMEYGYEVSYAIAPTGLTTRTVTGYIRIPATRNRVDDRSIPDVADRWREDVIPARLVGFRRTNPGTFRSSYDKATLEFTVEDAQLPGPPPPPGVLTWDISESLSTSSLAMLQWTGSVEARYAIAPGFSPEQGQRHFLRLAADRIATLRQSQGVSKGKVFVTGMRVGVSDQASTDQLPTFTATLLYRVNAASLTAFLAGHGLWRRLPETGGWAAWDRSMGAVFSPRGIAGLYLSPGEDRIVDLCDPGGRTGPPAASPPAQPQTNLLRGGLFTPPKPSESWLRYRAWIEVEADGGTSTLRTIPTGLPASGTRPPAPGLPALTADDLLALFASQGNRNTLAEFAGGVLDNSSPGTPGRLPAGGTLLNEPAVTVTQRAAAIVTLVLNVRAVRVAYPVPCPVLYGPDGRPLQPDLRPGEAVWRQEEVGNLGDGQTVYAAAARLRYTLPSDVAAQVGLDDLVMYNPLQHGDG